MRPMWRNDAETARHGCDVSVSGPKSAPQRTRSAAVGRMIEIPERTIARNTATFVARRMCVAHGFGGGGGGGSSDMVRDSTYPAYRSHPPRRGIFRRRTPCATRK